MTTLKNVATEVAAAKSNVRAARSVTEPEPRDRAEEGPTEIARAAEAALKGSGYDALRRIACEFHEGKLTLRGRVATYYLKQVAQSALRELVDGHAAIARIDNQIEVYVLAPK
ncbi:MAG: hypothetical protein FJ297_17960 [Planctomycetes bacterium]|nr:hypothetical protein [Planctomycetota bacterium]